MVRSNSMRSVLLYQNKSYISENEHIYYSVIIEYLSFNVLLFILKRLMILKTVVMKVTAQSMLTEK